MTEKRQKKVTKACNTCRLRRKKCDGLHPCALCSENKIECLYSNDPKRRGPPSGYLRHVETRLALLEALLGLFISVTNSSPERQDVVATDPFIDAAQRLADESKRCTQDVWDEHTLAWTTCPSAKVIDELAHTFAPYNSRTEQEAAPKALLPPRNLDGLTDTLVPPQTSELSVSASSAGPSAVAQSSPRSPSTPISNLDNTAVEFHLTMPLFSREPFQTCTTDPIRPSSTLGLDPTEAPSWPCSLPPLRVRKAPFDTAPRKEASGLGQGAPFCSASPMDVDNMQADTVDSGDSNFLSEGGQDAGIIWRSSRHTQTSDLDIQHLLSTKSLELPPPQILSHIVDVYYGAVWQTFPLLPTRPTLERLISAIPVHSDPFTTVLLALCAYCAHLSPLPNDDGEDSSTVANLWYQRARHGVQICITNGSSVEVAQALLLLAMTDYGQGNESQAWFLTGLAIRVGQDMDLNGDLPSTYEQKNLPPPEIRLRRNIWRVSLMLDLFLSLHFGRAPALSDSLRSATKYEVEQSEYATHPVPTFLHTVALCQTISRIYLHLYMACDTPGLQTPAEKLTALSEELESWYRSLPAYYSVAVANQSDRQDVLELNMLYQVAVILLYHPFCWENAMPHATDALVEAAAVFDELLRRYRPVQKQMLRSSSQPPLFPNSNLIYYIFAAAFAHLSGYKILCLQSSLRGTSVVLSTERLVLQTRSRLSHCLEALKTTEKAWKLAQRLGNSLDKLMEDNGLRDGPTPELLKSALGKRVWEDDKTAQNTEDVITAEGKSGGSLSVVMTPKGQNPRLGPSNWGGESLVRPADSQSSQRGKRFNAAAFPSFKWLSEDCDNKSAGYTKIWNGVWDI